MSIPRRHHLLPAFYLRGFCNRDLHETEDHESHPSRCRVWIYDRMQGSVRVSRVANVAVEKHFYSADVPGGGRDPEPEQQLSVLESHASRIIRSLRYGDDMTDTDRAWLARFVAYAKFRTPSYRTWLEGFAEATYPQMRKRLFPTVYSIKEYLRIKGLPVDQIPQEAFEGMYRDVHEKASGLPVDKNYMLQRMFEMGDRTAEVLFGFDWTFAWADENTPFVTSDDPFLILDEDMNAPAGFVGEARIATPGARKVLPLDQEVCLLIGTGAPSAHHVRVDHRTTHQLNIEQSRHYNRWLIATDGALLRRVSGSARET